MRVITETAPAEPKPRRRLTTTGAFVAASVLIFLLSLTQNGYYTDGEKPDAWAPSFGLLLVGCLGVFEGIPAWLANPMLAVSWLLLGLRRSPLAALGLSVAALGCALSFLLHKRILTDEAGHYANITGYGPGYWLWVASIVVALVGCCVALRTPERA